MIYLSLILLTIIPRLYYINCFNQIEIAHCMAHNLLNLLDNYQQNLSLHFPLQYHLFVTNFHLNFRNLPLNLRENKAETV